MKKNVMLLSAILLAILAAFTVNAKEKENKCGHPCQTDLKNVCCTGTEVADNGDIIAWSQKGIHVIETPANQLQ